MIVLCQSRPYNKEWGIRIMFKNILIASVIAYLLWQNMTIASQVSQLEQSLLVNIAQRQAQQTEIYNLQVELSELQQSFWLSE